MSFKNAKPAKQNKKAEKSRKFEDEGMPKMKAPIKGSKDRGGKKWAEFEDDDE